MAKKLRRAALMPMLSASLLALGEPALATVSDPTPSSRVTFYDYYRFIRYVLGHATGYLLDDPAVLAGTSRHDPWTQNVNGATSQVPGSRTDFVSTLFWMGYDLSSHIGLGANQRLVIGGFYRRDWAWTETSGVSEQRSHNNALGFLVGYELDNWHLAGSAGFDWGGARFTSLPGGAFGRFDTSGHFGSLAIGRVFTLWGDQLPTDRTAPTRWPFTTQQFSVHVDPGVYIAYGRSVADAFTDSTGVAFGREAERAWTFGGKVTLSAVFPQVNGPIWRPYIEFTLDRQISYRHTVALPAAGQVAQLDHDKTYWGVNGGVSVWLNRNIAMGAAGFFRGSGSQESGGGLFWIRVNLFGPGGYLRGALSR
jgi:hypothetical protein